MKIVGTIIGMEWEIIIDYTEFFFNLGYNLF